MIEDELKKLRFSAVVERPRDRILGAAATARKDQRIGRWIGGVAATAITLAFLAVAMGEKDSPRSPSTNPDMGFHPRYSFPSESIQEGGPWRR